MATLVAFWCTYNCLKTLFQILKKDEAKNKERVNYEK